VRSLAPPCTRRLLDGQGLQGVASLPTDYGREMVDLQKAQFMRERIGQEFTGFIAGLAAFGLFVDWTVILSRAWFASPPYGTTPTNSTRKNISSKAAAPTALPHGRSRPDQSSPRPRLSRGDRAGTNLGHVDNMTIPGLY